MAVSQDNQVEDKPKMACKGVWKLFGPDPTRFLRQHDGAPSIEAIKESGYIPAVVDATLEIYTGEILVLMGLSGSGKSTLVRCLSRLIEPTSGRIDLDGQDLLAASPKELIEIRRHKMGMVFQHFALFPHRTVAENVAFPLEAQGVDRATRSAAAESILELVGLDGRGGYYPRELSGGQQQRVGIGRSLAADPDVWLLDEPFSALDPLIRREMQDEFLRLQADLGKTIVFITHDFDEAIRLADRIAIMFEGQIVQLGTAEELITNPATDYVEAFTKNVQRDKILSVAALMKTALMTTNGAKPESDQKTSSLPDALSVHIGDRIGDVAGMILSTEEPVLVLDDDGTAVGTINRHDVISSLYGSPTAKVND